MGGPSPCWTDVGVKGRPIGRRNLQRDVAEVYLQNLGRGRNQSLLQSHTFARKLHLLIESSRVKVRRGGGGGGGWVAGGTVTTIGMPRTASASMTSVEPSSAKQAEVPLLFLRFLEQDGDKSDEQTRMLFSPPKASASSDAVLTPATLLGAPVQALSQSRGIFQMQLGKWWKRLLVCWDLRSITTTSGFLQRTRTKAENTSAVKTGQ